MTLIGLSQKREKVVIRGHAVVSIRLNMPQTSKIAHTPFGRWSAHPPILSLSRELICNRNLNTLNSDPRRFYHGRLVSFKGTTVDRFVGLMTVYLATE